MKAFKPEPHMQTPSNAGRHTSTKFQVPNARCLCGALVAKVLGMLVDTLLQRPAVERRGWGCGVGTALDSCTPLSSGVAESASCLPARRLGPWGNICYAQKCCGCSCPVQSMRGALLLWSGLQTRRW